MMANTDERSRLHGLLKSFDVAMLVTIAEGGDVHSRRMAIAQVDDDCTVWFVTSKASAKVREADSRHRAQVVCQKGWSAFVALTGRTTVIDDSATLDRLWKKSYEVWFPKGKSDPDVTLMRVDPEEGEYWDETGTNKLRYLFSAAKAFVSGTRPTVGGRDEHASVKMKS
jgi:general stress protein 26